MRLRFLAEKLHLEMNPLPVVEHATQIQNLIELLVQMVFFGLRQNFMALLGVGGGGHRVAQHVG